MNKPAVYVVTRDGRRIEDRNYTTSGDANYRAVSLRRLLKLWKDEDAFKVRVVKTEKPNRIR